MENKASEEFLTEALINGTFSMEDTENALRRSLDHSFSYLYRLQQSMVDYEEYHYTAKNVVVNPDYGDMYLDKQDRICINFKSSLIAPHNREKYKWSKYFEKEIPFISGNKISGINEDIISNKQLFTKIPIIVIDGKMLRNFSLVIHDTYFTAILPFSKKFFFQYNNETKKYPWNSELPNENGTKGHNEYRDHSIDVQIVANSYLFDYETNAPLLQLQSTTNNYDTIQVENVRNFPDITQTGCLFAVIYTSASDDDFHLGTCLQDVDIIKTGDKITSLKMNWDLETLKFLRTTKKEFIIRFYFYRNLRKHFGYRGNDILVRNFENKNASEYFIIQKEEYETLEMPVPITSFMLMKINANDYSNMTDHGTWTLVDHNIISLNYPNIYHIETNVIENDKFRVYYFYQPGYELSYTYMYRFYMRYLYFKWAQPRKMSLEETINKLYFGDIDVAKDFKNNTGNEDEILVSRQADILLNDGELKKEQVGAFINYVTESIRTQESTTLDGCIDAFLTNADLQQYTPVAPSTIEFWKLFFYVVQSDIPEYRYDELDYLHGKEDKNADGTFYDEMSPFEYKVKKLKSFIADDMKCLHEYLIQQNKTSIKYELIIDTESMTDKVRTISEVNKYEFEEPMYVFTFEKMYGDENVGCRFFIDGFFYGEFVHENNGFIDFIYVPVSKMPDDSYVEIEMFPSYIRDQEFVIDSKDDYFEILLEKKDDIYPTLSDVVITDKDDIYHTYPHKDFVLKVVDENYNFYTGNTEVDMYRIRGTYNITSDIWLDNNTNERYVGVVFPTMVYRNNSEIDTISDKLDIWKSYLTEKQNVELLTKMNNVRSQIESGSVSMHYARDLILNLLEDIREFIYEVEDAEKLVLCDEHRIFFSDCNNVRTNTLSSYWRLDKEDLLDLEDIGEVEAYYKEYDKNDVKVSDAYLSYTDLEERVEKDSFRLEKQNIIKIAHYDSSNVLVNYVTIDDIPSSAARTNRTVIKELIQKMSYTQNGETYTTDGYYGSDGMHYKSNGQPDKDNSISVKMLQNLIDSGIAVKCKKYPTNNEFIITEDTNYIDYTQVTDLEKSIIDKDNKGVNSTRLYRLRIYLNNDALIGKELCFHINKTSIFNYEILPYTTYPEADMNIINPEHGDEYIRVFQDGRLLSKNKYEFMTNLNNPRIQMLKRVKKGTRLCFDGTPYRNRLVYYRNELTPEKNGDLYIDLRKAINKPFDMRYYEVYLNGRRLTKRNVYPVSQWEIRLAGVHSIYNLEIYEKDRDWEYYSCDFGNYFTVSDLFESDFMEDEIREKMLEEIFGKLPKNDNTEEKEDWNKYLDTYTIFFEIFYYTRLLPLGLANGDENEFNYDDIKENFDIIFKLFLTQGKDGSNILLLNPDVFYAGEDEDRWNVYMTGNDDAFADNGFIEED